MNFSRTLQFTLLTGTPGHWGTPAQGLWDSGTLEHQDAGTLGGLQVPTYNKRVVIFSCVLRNQLKDLLGNRQTNRQTDKQTKSQFSNFYFWWKPKTLRTKNEVTIPKDGKNP